MDLTNVRGYPHMMNWLRTMVASLLTVALVISSAFGNQALASPSAGLYWKMEALGVKVYMTNVHPGYAGPKVGEVPHTNFHVDYKNGGVYIKLVNLHITRYSANGQQCLYVWDKVPTRPGHEVYDNCKGDFNSVWAEARQEMESYINDLAELNLTSLQAAILVGILILAFAALLSLLTTAPIVILGGTVVAPITSLLQELRSTFLE